MVPPNMNTRLEEELQSAASTGDVDQLSLLMQDAEPLSEKLVQALMSRAAWKSHLPIITFLFEQFPFVPLEEETIRAAVYSGSIPLFSALMARDSSVINMQFDKRGTPLIVAYTSKQPIDFLHFLLESGADPNQDPEVTAYPIAIAAYFHTDLKVVDLLLDHGARLERSGALSVAARRGNESMLRHLLHHGAKPEFDATELGSQQSPLHVAVRQRHVGILKILLEYGADARHVDSKGKTVMDVAKEMVESGEDMSEIMQLLDSYEK